MSKRYEMRKVREVAQRYYAERASFPLTARAARITREAAFEDGARWQAQQPTEITNKMVAKAAEAIARVNSALCDYTPSDPGDVYMRDARAALEAALGGEA